VPISAHLIGDTPPVASKSLSEPLTKINRTSLLKMAQAWLILADHAEKTALQMSSPIQKSVRE